MNNRYAILFSIIGILVHFCSDSQSTQMWGMNRWGGEDGVGAVFSTDNNGDFHQLESHIQKDSNGFPQFTQIIQTSDGELYGAAGTIYKIDTTTNEVLPMVTFDDELHGAIIQGAIIEGSDGMIYGVALEGGENDEGTIYQYEISTGELTKILDFDDVLKGKHPKTIFEGSNGKLYGTTYLGGINNFGVFFEFDLETDTYTKILDFDGSENGRSPNGNLTEVDEKIYGVTRFGGLFAAGVIYEYDLVTSGFSKKLDFDGGDNGHGPFSGFSKSPSDHLYGTTAYGGIYGEGIIYEYDYALNVIVKKHDFFAETNGGYPEGMPVEFEDGKLYGMTRYGGAVNFGTLYSFDLETSEFEKLRDLGEILGSGRNPTGSLMQASNGMVYGNISGGGISAGTLFTYDIGTGMYTKIFTFQNSKDGSQPQCTLVQSSGGKFFGTAPEGGFYIRGTIFEYCPASGKMIARHHFRNTDGRNPLHTLFEASDGLMYGTTQFGGEFDEGVLFSFDPVTYAFSKKIDFSGGDDGGWVEGKLTQASNGNIYGVTHRGGSEGDGVLYEYNPVTEIMVKKWDFSSVESGEKPTAGLLQASNGKLYGTTREGGTTGDGVLYEYDLETETFTKLVDFNGSELGEFPSEELIEASDGLLYGVCEQGGSFDGGVIFSFDTESNTLNVLYSFLGSAGRFPRAALLEAENEKLYGTTTNGGDFNIGVIFEYDVSTEIFTKKHDFNETLGMRSYGGLLEVEDCYLPCSNGLTSLNGTDFCSSDTTLLSVNPMDTVSNMWYLYVESCGGELIDSAMSGEFIVAPEVTTQYFIQPLIECAGSPPCISITINVGDTIPPSTPVLEDIYGDCSGVSLTIPTTTDNCIPLIEGSTSDPLIYNEVGSYIVDWSFDDGNGNVTTVPQNVIISDTTAPVPDLVELEDLLSECPVDSIVLPSATDDCSEGVIVEHDIEFPITEPGTTIVTWTFTDGSGNFSTQTQNITITPIDNSVTQIDELSIHANASGYTYQWVDCDNDNAPIDGETDQLFVAPSHGSFAVVIDNGLCSVMSDCSELSVGLENNDFGGQLTIYPNPTLGRLFIDLGNDYSNITVTVQNSMGQQLVNKTIFHASVFEIILEGAAGIYIVDIYTGDGKTASLQVVKQ